MDNQKELKEYIVTLKNSDDLDDFYDDMETPGGNLYIPNRRVEVCHRREISRNTHYFLTEEETLLLKKDPRVLDVIKKEELDEMVIRPRYNQFSNDWNKSSTPSSTNRNWGLLRCVEGQQRTNWGSNGTVSQSGEIVVTSSGKNVDVVIVDGHLNADHPEFAKNPDGSGGSRVVFYNWLQHTPAITGGSAGSYVYPSGSLLLNGDDNHGMHVAGTVCGNTQGWARDANIYNISPYSSNPNSGVPSFIFDYVREFHRNKQILPLTGIKNPTICNNSWGSFFQIPRSSITNVNWRGVNYTSFTNADLNTYGLVDYDTSFVYVEAWTNALVADVIDAINDGIIFVGAAGNSNLRIESPGGQDYNNTITWSGITRNYHRGSWNVTGGNSICVGAMSATVTEFKASFSNSGPRVDIYSPGSNIISSLHDGTVDGGSITVVGDSRNTSYKLGKYNGTSMASPQVCGALACLLEQNPRMKQSDCVEYIQKYSSKNQISDTGGGYTDVTSLKGSVNRYLFFNKERKESGVILPRLTYKSRPDSGKIWPRRNTLFTK